MKLEIEMITMMMMMTMMITQLTGNETQVS